MASQPNPFVTPEEYLAAERKAQSKSEYLNGEVYAMSGVSRKHDRIAVNLIAALSQALRGSPCDIHTSDMRVRAGRSKAYFYPDLTVVCGEPRFEDIEFDVLLNPTVIIEILSPTTKNFDRGEKFEAYRQVDSLVEYVLVAQNRIYIEQWTKRDGHWVLTEVESQEAALEIRSAGVSIPIATIYDRIPLD